MAEHDANKEALDQVERVTDSDPAKGDDLLESPDLLVFPPIGELVWLDWA